MKINKEYRKWRKLGILITHTHIHALIDMSIWENSFHFLLNPSTFPFNWAISFSNLRGSQWLTTWLFWGKKHLFYRKRNNLLPSLEDFVSYLKNVIRLEKEIAQLNGNLEEFKRKWKEFSQIDISMSAWMCLCVIIIPNFLHFLYSLFLFIPRYLGMFLHLKYMRSL